MTMNKLLGITLALVMLTGSIPLGFSEPLRVQLEQGLEIDQIQCDNPNHVLVLRTNGNVACVTEKMAERLGWGIIEDIFEVPIKQIISNDPLAVKGKSFEPSEWAAPYYAHISFPETIEIGKEFDISYMYQWAEMEYDEEDQVWEYDNLPDPSYDLSLGLRAQILTLTPTKIIDAEKLVEEPVEIMYEDTVQNLYKGIHEYEGYEKVYEGKYTFAVEQIPEDYEINEIQIQIRITDFYIWNLYLENIGDKYYLTETPILRSYESGYEGIDLTEEFYKLQDEINSERYQESLVYQQWLLDNNIETWDEDWFENKPYLQDADWLAQYNGDLESEQNTPEDIPDYIWSTLLETYRQVLSDDPEFDVKEHLSADQNFTEESIERFLDTYPELRTQSFNSVANFLLPLAYGSSHTTPFSFIHGTINVGELDSNNLIPATNIKICAYSNVASGEWFVMSFRGSDACTFTDKTTGAFGFATDLVDFVTERNNPDIKIGISFDDDKVRFLEDGAANIPYVQFIKTKNNHSSGNIGLGTVPIVGIPSQDIYFMVKDVTGSFDKVNDKFGESMPKVKIIWSNLLHTSQKDPSSSYLLSENMIFVGTDRNEYPPSILHEYGHHVMLSKYVEEGGSYPPAIGTGCQRHTFGSYEDLNCAFTEGWADFMVGFALEESTYQHSSLISINLEDREQNNNVITTGTHIEGNTAGLLWDIIDGTGETGNSDAEKYDDTDSLFIELWDAFGERANTVLEFKSNWDQTNNEEIDRIFYLNTLTNTFTPPVVVPPMTDFNIPFQDDFEGNLSKWTLSGDRNWDIRTVNGDRVAEGDNCDDYCYMDINQTFDFRNYKEAQIHFDRFVDKSDDNDEGIYFEISTNGGSSWQIVQSWTEDNKMDDNTWHQTIIILDEYLDESSVDIRFTSKSSSGNEDNRIDDVTFYVKFNDGGGGNPPPPTDSDGDGIPDNRDACPNQPETFNGFEDSDGCPDTVPVSKNMILTVTSPTSGQEFTSLSVPVVASVELFGGLEMMRYVVAVNFQNTDVISTSSTQLRLTLDESDNLREGNNRIEVMATPSESRYFKSQIINFVITLPDNTDPVITVPADFITEATAVLTLLTQSDYGTATATDDVDPNPIITNNAPSTFPIGDTIITWSATDGSNVATDEQTITIQDTTVPTITAPDDVTKEATQVNTPLSQSDYGIATGTDIFGVTITNNAPATFPLGDTTITWTATDSSTNTATADQIVTIQDTTVPIISAPDDVTVEATGIFTQVTVDDPIISDIFPVEFVVDSDFNLPLGDTIITYTATDANELESTAIQIITITDNTNPTITAPSSITAEATAINTPLSDLTLGNPSGSDIFGVTITNDIPLTFSLGNTTIIYTATDGNNNTATATQTVTITDTIIPSIIAPVAFTTEATAVLSPITSADYGTATGSDIFEPVVITSDANSFPLGDTIITWTATDDNGLTNTATQIITIIDSTAPTVTSPSNQSFEATALLTPLDETNYGTATVSDIFEPIILTNDAPATFALNNTTITWNVTDANGNTNTSTQIITIQDTTVPEITPPSDYTTEATGEFTPLTSDDYGTATATDFFPVIITNDAPDSFPLGITTINWIATDENGNTETVNQTVIVQDTIAPVIAVPLDQSFNVISVNTPLDQDDYGSPITTDIFDVTVSHNAPDAFPVGDTIITWTATDIHENSVTANQTITVHDEENLYGFNIAFDNMTNNIVYTWDFGENPDRSNCFSKAELMVQPNTPYHFFGTDLTTFEKGGGMTKTRAAPHPETIIPCNGNTTINISDFDFPNDPYNGSWYAIWYSFYETIDNVHHSLREAQFAYSSIGTHMSLTCDMAANEIARGVFPKTNNYVYDSEKMVYSILSSNLCNDPNRDPVVISEYFEIIDIIPPIISLDGENPQTIELGEGYTELGATTNDGSPVTIDDSEFVDAVGTHTIYYDSVDLAGNNAVQVTRTVNVVDTVPPVITLNGDNPQIIVVGSSYQELGAIATDNSDGDISTSIIIDSASVDTNTIDSYTVTYDVTDSSNNDAIQVTRTINILDTTPPVFNQLISDITEEATSSSGAIVSFSLPEASDNIDGTITSICDPISDSQFPLGDTQVTCTATDSSENSDDTSFIVTVQDTTLPFITAPADFTTEGRDGITCPVAFIESSVAPLTFVRHEADVSCYILSQNDYGIATGSDIFGVTITSDAPDSFPLGTTIITWTAIDGNQLESTATQTITIIATGITA